MKSDQTPQTRILLQSSAERTASSALRLFLILYAAFLFTLILFQVAFANRVTVGDEDSLYNAIYMYQHYGKVTYPMQLQIDYMTVHPPTHYFIVGALTKTGLQVFHAAAIPVLLIVLIAFFAILTGRFSDVAKLSLLTGFTLAALVYVPPSTIRPDLHLTFAWFCSVVLFEAARSQQWDNKRLLLGSFFAAYASGLHYWGLASALMLPAYFLYILIRPQGVRPGTKLAYMVTGALLFYIPFAAFFVIPHFRQIVEMLRAANATGGGIRASIQTQLVQISGWINTAWPPEIPFLGRLFYDPIRKLNLPPLVFALPVLFATPSLRGLSLPGAILPLFVLTMVSRKGGLFYMAPEFILYSIAACTLFFVLSEWVLRRIKASTLLSYAAPSLAAALVLLRCGDAPKLGVTSRILDWDIARAANQRIIGPNAFAALNQCWAWYTCGAAKLYWIVSPTQWDFMERVDRQRKFDSVVLLNDWFGNNHKTIPFPEFYTDRKLNLRGFYFPARAHSEEDHLLAVLHLTTRTDLVKHGFGYDRGRGVLNEYLESPGGPWMFVSIKAYLEYPDQWPMDAVYFERFLMEQPIGKEPSLFAFVTSREKWQRDRSRLAALGTIRDEVPLTMREVQLRDLLSTLDNRPIQFMTNQPDIR